MLNFVLMRSAFCRGVGETRADNKGWAMKRTRPSKKVWCSGLGLCLEMLLVFDFGQGLRCGWSIRHCRCHWIMAAFFCFLALLPHSFVLVRCLICTVPQMIPNRKWSRNRKWSPKWTANDPRPQVIPKVDRKWSRKKNRNDLDSS